MIGSLRACYSLVLELPDAGQCKWNARVLIGTLPWLLEVCLRYAQKVFLLLKAMDNQQDRQVPGGRPVPPCHSSAGLKKGRGLEALPLPPDSLTSMSLRQ